MANTIPGTDALPGLQEAPAPQRLWTPGRLVSVGFVVAVVLGLLGLLAYGLVASRASTSGNVPVAVRPAQPFTLSMFDGSQLSLSDLRGKVVMVNFWASWCVPCQDEAGTLARAYAKYKDQNVVFVGVNIWDEKQDALDFMTNYGVKYPAGVDPKGTIAIDYGVSGVPESYFIDKEGKLVHKYVGPLNDSQIAALLDSTLK